MCAVILSSEERERLRKANAERYKEYLEWGFRLPEPFKTIWLSRFAIGPLCFMIFMFCITECGKTPRETISPAPAAIEQTRPSAFPTTPAEPSRP